MSHEDGAAINPFHRAEHWGSEWWAVYTNEMNVVCGNPGRFSEGGGILVILYERKLEDGGD